MQKLRDRDDPEARRDGHDAEDHELPPRPEGRPLVDDPDLGPLVCPDRARARPVLLGNRPLKQRVQDHHSQGDRTHARGHPEAPDEASRRLHDRDGGQFAGEVVHPPDADVEAKHKAEDACAGAVVALDNTIGSRSAG